MFNPNSSIDNPTRLAYKKDQKGMFNAWWMLEKIQFTAATDDLRDGDAIIFEGKEWYVKGWRSSGAHRNIINDQGNPTLETGVVTDRVTISATRSEIFAHGKRLKYSGPENVG